ncbi:MAG: C-GCAxxG-C-C family protein [Pseudomonadota bacterium]
MIDQAVRRSGELFQTGFFCAESVLLAIAEAKGIRSDIVPKIATGFCSGIARTGRTCGALSGGIMAIGMLFGRSTPGESVLDTYDRVRQLLDMFDSKFGSTTCKELIGCDLGTEEGRKYFQESDLRQRCTRITEETTRMAMNLIDGPGAA